ncbi:MAG: hypothetical protein QGG36_13535 [Pirellulaceae bacterium]|jgi:CheY-like chemotaxis protein|nr:hypothetical protein [Pirellulaceae bacterium]MDP7016819.1 hypothetical protein [Pirellulaceae bacterium]
MADDAQTCMDAGCDDYAAKPIDRQLLIDLIAHHVQRSKTRGAAEEAMA